MDDGTIAALSTPPGRGGISVIRLSGTGAHRIIRRLAPSLPRKPSCRRMYRATIVDGERHLDEGMITLFGSPQSYTGEDMAEISLHGNPLLVDRVLQRICGMGARQALPGEFTYRAFRHGKIDLIQAEAVNELIQSTPAFHAGLALSHLRGSLSDRVSRMREALVSVGVSIETAIEFQEDHRLEPSRLQEQLADTLEICRGILMASGLNENLARERRVVIMGRVNAGKSSLFNRLLGHERAIVSDTPGTTRDFITERLFLDGDPLQLVDIAGSQDGSTDPLELEGMRRGEEILASCDAVIVLLDGSSSPLPVDEALVRRVRHKQRFLAVNKMDIAVRDVVRQLEECFPRENLHKLSARSGEGCEPVVDFLKDQIRSAEGEEIEYAVSRRQKSIFEDIGDRLGSLHARVERDPVAALQTEAELIAEEVRELLDLIGRLTGEITDREILDGIFGRFCIGK